MLARFKENGCIVDVVYDKDKQMWKSFVEGKWEYYDEERLVFIENIDWKKVRADIAMELVKQIPYDAFSRNDYWVDYVFDRANELTKKLMQEIEE